MMPICLHRLQLEQNRSCSSRSQLALLLRFNKLSSSDRDFASKWVISFAEGHIIDAIKLRVDLVALNVGIIL